MKLLKWGYIGFRVLGHRVSGSLRGKTGKSIGHWPGETADQVSASNGDGFASRSPQLGLYKSPTF